MLDKVTNVTVENWHNNPKAAPVFTIWTVFKGLTPILISLVTLSVSYLVYSSNQEGMSVNISRDQTVAAAYVPLIGPMINPELESLDLALLSRWTVSIVNTSVTATIPVTAIRFVVMDAIGYGLTIDTKQATVPMLTSIKELSGKDIELPISLKPGEVRKFSLFAVTPVSKLAYPGSQSNSAMYEDPETVMHPKSSVPYMLHETMGKVKGLDPFGNRGDFGIDFTLASKDKPRQPCVSIWFETGRGNTFIGHGYWYSQIFRENLDHTSTRVVPRKCPEPRRL